MGKTYAIADLHGRFDILEAALDRIEADPNGGTIVFTGDYVDRGPWSKAVLDRLMSGPISEKWNWVCLKGNHEDMMVECVSGRSELSWWLGNGGAETLASFGGSIPLSYLEWADRLPHVYRDAHRIFAHAGVDPTIPLDEQTDAMLLWHRVPKHRDVHHPAGFIVHGHTPFEDGPVLTGNRCNLDTAACWTGRLVVAVFDDDQPGEPVEFLSIQMPTLGELETA